MVAKSVILLVAFPVLVHAIFTLTSLVLGPVLPSVLTLAGTWSDLAGKAVVVATLPCVSPSACADGCGRSACKTIAGARITFPGGSERRAPDLPLWI
jgi:hypothetical protein